MEITLCCWVSFGKLDGNDWEEDFEVTEEEYKRLMAVAERGDEFESAEDVKDIYNRLYDEMVKEATMQLLEIDEDIAEEYGEDEEWSADYLYCYGLRFMESFYEENCSDEEDVEDA